MKTTWKIISCLSVTALLFLLTVNAKAQKVEFGVRYMPTFTSFEMKTYSGGTVKGETVLGYGVGALLGFNVTNHLEFQAEVIYNSISQKYKEQDVEREINLKYVNVPILLSLNTGKTNRFNLNAVVGPQIGFNVGSSVHTTGGDGTTNATAVLSVKQSDIGFAYGAGMDFGLNETQTIRFGLGFRGVFGLVDISSDSDEIKNSDEYYILDKTHVKTYSAYFGFSFLF